MTSLVTKCLFIFISLKNWNQLRKWDFNMFNRRTLLLNNDIKNFCMRTLLNHLLPLNFVTNTTRTFWSKIANSFIQQEYNLPVRFIYIQFRYLFMICDCNTFCANWWLIVWKTREKMLWTGSKILQVHDLLKHPSLKVQQFVINLILINQQWFSQFTFSSYKI